MCAAIDLANGGLVEGAIRFSDGAVAPFDIVSSGVGALPDRDPSQPEAVELTGPTEVTGRLHGRKAERFVRPLIHPLNAPLLGITGSAVPHLDPVRRPAFARRREPTGLLQVGASDRRRLHCFFPWRGATIDLPLVDRRVALSWRSADRRPSRSAAASVVDAPPRQLLQGRRRPPPPLSRAN